MKYVEASQFGGPDVLALKEKETPEPDEGLLLVEVRAAGINYTDVMARNSLWCKLLFLGSVLNESTPAAA